MCQQSNEVDATAEVAEVEEAEEGEEVGLMPPLPPIGAQDTLTYPHLRPVDYIGNLDEEPGHVQTATTAPGET